jgi:FkbM family methyltransferase
VNLKYAARDTISYSFQLLLGRRNLYRLARMLTYRARRDTTENLGEKNGEFAVQDAVFTQPGAKIVFDVGANIGDWCGRLLKSFPDAEVQLHAFEPCTGTFAELESRITDRRLTAIKAACSDLSGTAQMNLVGDNCGRNSLVPGLPDQRASETVRLATIDEYCAEQGLHRIDLLKIDAEGYDLAVLRGSRQMLSTGAITVLQFEYNHRWIHSRALLKDAFELLGGSGYRVGKLSSEGVEFYPQWDRQLEDYCENNYIACLPSACRLFRAVRAEWLVPDA